MTDVGTPGSSGDDILASLWEESEPIIRARIKSLEDVAVEVLQGTLDSDTRATGLTNAHRLAGSLGTFGLPDQGRLAREVELLLQGTRPLSQDDALRLSELVVELGQDLPAPKDEPRPPPPAARRAWRADIRLLVVERDQDLAAAIIEEAAGSGLRSQAAATLDEARAIMVTLRPNAIVVNPAVGTTADEGTAFVVELARALRVMTVVLTEAPLLGGRPEVARTGGDAFLTKPTSPRAVVDAVRRVFERRRARATVLAVDDDPSVLAVLRAALDRHDLRVEVLDDPSQFWDVLEQVMPELLLLGVDMPDIDGLDLCRVVRSDARWERLPVVFITAHAGEERVRAMFAAGGDDHIGKPIIPAEVLSRVVNRLERIRAQADLARTDPQTGLLTRPSFTGAVDQMLSVARRHGAPVVAVCVEPEPASAAAAAAAAAVLGRWFRVEDPVGVWELPRLAVGLYGLDAPEAVERVALVLEMVRGEGFAASAGVAEFPVDGADVASLMAAAAAALDRARDEGGDRVLVAAPLAGPSGATVDVLVVDDDEALGSLLVHALETRGFRTLWLQDGAQTAAMLTGTPPDLHARVVLLDVGLPGLDGLSLLRRLEAAGTLSRSRVIMITVRTTEAEVLEAFELGAFDHVAKPLSVPVLIHRVRRALDTLPA